MRRGNARRNVLHTAAVEPARFTNYIHETSSLAKGDTVVTAKPFKVPEDMYADISYAVSTAPSGKATGVHGVFPEALKLDDELAVKAIWPYGRNADNWVSRRPSGVDLC